MGFAEKRAELLRIAETADEETTGKLIDFYHHLAPGNEFSEEDLAEFERRIDEHRQNPESGIPFEDMMIRLRAQVAQIREMVNIDESINSKGSRFSEQELAQFHATREKYADPDAKTILMEDAHAYIRSVKTT